MRDHDHAAQGAADGAHDVRDRAPGRRTLTMGLPARGDAGGARTPPEPYVAPSAEESAALSRNLDEALRPDLFAAPAPAADTVWRKATANVRDPGDAPGDSFAAATAGGGGAVPYRADMEASFGEDFSGVEAFFGRAAPLADLGAEAATRREQIAFADATPSRELVAHELTHVVQSRRAGGGGVQCKDAVSSPSHEAEHEADAVAASVVRGERVAVRATPRAEVSLRGSCYTTRTPSEELTQHGLAPHAPVVVVEDEVDKVELRRRAEAGEPVKVSYARKGDAKTGYYTIPARLLDVGSYYQATSKSNNPDEAAGADQAKFVSPPAAARIVGGDVEIDVVFQTRNCWDRAMWEVTLQPDHGPARLLDADPRQWNNPAWEPKSMNEHSFQAYPFRPGFGGLPRHGDGDARAERVVRLRVPLEIMRKVFGKGLSVSSKVCIGMRIRYDAKITPATATAEEYSDAFGFEGQMHSWGLARGDHDASYVDLSRVAEQLGLAPGDWATPEEVWKQPLGPNPLPNLRVPFPNAYGPRLGPLAPEGQFSGESGPSKLKMATRIENEATLALSSLGKLQDLIQVLAGLCGKDTDITDIMARGGAPLDGFQWKLQPEGEPLVFTDLYFDDPLFHALRSGVGIRRRSTTEATKLNVKTGRGYNVGRIDDDGKGGYRERRTGKPEDKSDIYRRHEIGFDINEGAPHEAIGAFLGGGLDGKGRSDDEWNRGAEQANLTAIEETSEPIDFARLAPKMQLKGHRTKFKLSAIKGGRAINIEISCDHTVGRTFDQSKLDQRTDQQIVDDLGTNHHIYNIEMELEHLGAGKGGDTSGSTQPPQVRPNEPGIGRIELIEPGVEREPTTPLPTKRPPPGHPGRLYMRDDTEAEAFNTPSFQVFYRAYERFVEFARREAIVERKDAAPERGIGEKELSQAPQKLEALFEQLAPDLAPKGGMPKNVKREKGGIEEYTLSKAALLRLKGWGLEPVPVKPDGDCLYQALIATLGLGDSVIELREKAAKELERNKRRYGKALKSSESIESVAAKIRTLGAFAGTDGDLAPLLLGDVLRIQIASVDAASGAVSEVGTGQPVVLVHFTSPGFHYFGTRKKQD